MTNVLTSITDIFTAMIQWIAGSFSNVTEIFYDSTSGLTFMGTLAIMGLAVSVGFLIIGIVQRFLKFGA